MILRGKKKIFNYFIRVPSFDFYFDKLKKIIFFQKYIKLIENYFLTVVNDFEKKKSIDF
jgi:hypothetical protein